METVFKNLIMKNKFSLFIFFLIGMLFGLLIDFLIADMICKKFPYFYTKLVGNLDLMGSIEFSIFTLLAILSYKSKKHNLFWFSLGVISIGLVALTFNVS